MPAKGRIIQMEYYHKRRGIVKWGVAPYRSSVEAFGLVLLTNASIHDVAADGG